MKPTVKKMVRWGWMPLNPWQPWFAILQSTVGLFWKRVTFDQNDKGLTRTKGYFEKMLTTSCLSWPTCPPGYIWCHCCASLIVTVPLISYYQLYLPCGRKRVFEEGYGRMFAERPTGSRASRQSASSGQSILGQMTQSHPSTKSHHQKTPNPYLRRPCRSLPRLIASR